MRLSLRFIIPLFLALGALAYAVVPLVDRLTLQWFERDLDLRATLIASTVQEPLRDLIRAGNRNRLLQFFTRILQDERLYALGFCPLSRGQPIATPTLPPEIRCTQLDSYSSPSGQLLKSPDGPLLVSVRSLAVDGAPAGTLVLVHDMSFVARRSAETRKYLFYFFVGLGAMVSLITVAIAQLSWRGWLSPEQETGYYYGFANEGLWPLCHIAHVRPTFRTADWEQYVSVNRTFSRAVVDEANSPDPIVLVHDYHFALLPRMIQEELPAATIIAFWHIPWPNPEAFGICPWREALLDGLLGSTILGFHTQFHCNNFVDTVDRLLEARADREEFSVTYRGKVTAVKRYPISIEWPPSPELVAKPIDQCRLDVREQHNLPPDHAVGIGVERMDYTKGIEERLRAVERLLEIEPGWIGKFSFIQIAAPTRIHIEEYRAYEARVRDLATRINQRFPEAEHPPIILKIEHHQPDHIFGYYRAADLCMVTSLHDGMNLVAKEFVSARNDERGVLILSLFTGAARELPEALIVNPYDTDQCAAALQLALTMTRAEQRTRMRLMRGLIQDFNVFRWAGRMLMDAAAMRRRGRLPDIVAVPAGQRQQGPALKRIGLR